MYTQGMDLFWNHVNTSGVCWEWTSSKNAKGYGRYRREGRYYKAHRFSYELLVGPIPPGLVIDHLCKNRACVNPDHLEPVTPRENTRRAPGTGGWQRAKTHCPTGHEYTPENTTRRLHKGYVYRVCLTCRRAQSRGIKSPSF